MAVTVNRLSNGSLYLNSGSIATFNSATLPAGGQLGMFVNENGKKYQLVKVDSSSNALAANDVVSWIDYDDFVVTNDVSDISGTEANAANQPAGVAVGTGTIGYYCFIQVRGVCTIRTNQDDDIAAGDVLIVDGNEDGQCNSTAAGTAPINIPLAVATAADDDTADTVAAVLIVPLNGD